VVQWDLVDANRPDLAGEAGDETLGRGGFGRIDAADRRSEIVLTETLERDLGAEEESEIIDRQRMNAIEPRSDLEAPVLKAQRKASVRPEPIRRERATEPLDLEQFGGRVFGLRSLRRGQVSSPTIAPLLSSSARAAPPSYRGREAAEGSAFGMLRKS